MKVIGINPDHFQPVTNFERVNIQKGVAPVAGTEGQTIKNEDSGFFQSDPSHLVIDFLQKRKERQKRKEYVDHYKLRKGKRAYSSNKETKKTNQKGTKINLEV